MDLGTLRRAVLVAMINVGSIINERVSPPTSADARGRSKKFIKMASPKIPKIMEGTAARLLMFISIKLIKGFFRENSSK